MTKDFIKKYASSTWQKMRGRPPIHKTGHSTKDGYIRKSLSPQQNHRSSTSGGSSPSQSDQPNPNTSPRKNSSSVIPETQILQTERPPRTPPVPPTPAPRNITKSQKSGNKLDDCTEATEELIINHQHFSQSDVTTANEERQSSSEGIASEPNEKPENVDPENFTNSNSETSDSADDTNTVTNTNAPTTTNTNALSNIAETFVNTNVVDLKKTHELNESKSRDELDFSVGEVNYFPHPITSDYTSSYVRKEKKTLYPQSMIDDIVNKEKERVALVANSSDEEGGNSKKPQSTIITKENNTKKLIHTYYIYVVVFLSAIVGIVALLAPSVTKEFYQDFNLESSIKKMQATFPAQNRDVWLHLQVGLESIKNFSRPTVFMLVHHNKQGIAVDLAKQMGQTAAIYLNEDVQAQPTMIFNNELHLRDHGELISNYRDKLKQNHVMIIDGIERVPGKVAQGFRYFCDEYSPMVKEAAVFFTINLNLCPTVVQEEEFLKANVRDMTMMIEDCLKEAWKTELDINVIQPVLVRIVGSVLKIIPENNTET